MTKEEQKKSSIHLTLPKDTVKEIQIDAIIEEKSQSELLGEAYKFWKENKDK